MKKVWIIMGLMYFVQARVDSIPVIGNRCN